MRYGTRLVRPFDGRGRRCSASRGVREAAFIPEVLETRLSSHFRWARSTLQGDTVCVRPKLRGESRHPAASEVGGLDRGRVRAGRRGDLSAAAVRRRPRSRRRAARVDPSRLRPSTEIAAGSRDRVRGARPPRRSAATEPARETRTPVEPDARRSRHAVGGGAGDRPDRIEDLRHRGRRRLTRDATACSGRDRGFPWGIHGRSGKQSAQPSWGPEARIGETKPSNGRTLLDGVEVQRFGTV